jgi:hypothetical protein
MKKKQFKYYIWMINFKRKEEQLESVVNLPISLFRAIIISGVNLTVRRKETRQPL